MQEFWLLKRDLLKTGRVWVKICLIRCDPPLPASHLQPCKGICIAPEKSNNNYYCKHGFPWSQNHLSSRLPYISVQTCTLHSSKSGNKLLAINYSSDFLSKHKHTQCKVHWIDYNTSVSEQFSKSYIIFTKEMEYKQNFTAS